MHEHASCMRVQVAENLQRGMLANKGLFESVTSCMGYIYPGEAAAQQCQDKTLIRCSPPLSKLAYAKSSSNAFPIEFVVLFARVARSFRASGLSDAKNMLPKLAVSMPARSVTDNSEKTRH